MPVMICQAEEYAGRMVCGRCGLDWPKGAAGAAHPDCKDKADPPIRLTEMIAVAYGQARDIVGSQKACIAAEFRTTPFMPELRKAAVQVAIAETLERIKADEVIMGRLQGRK